MAILHETVEDTETIAEELDARFGERKRLWSFEAVPLASAWMRARRSVVGCVLVACCLGLGTPARAETFFDGRVVGVIDGDGIPCESLCAGRKPAQ